MLQGNDAAASEMNKHNKIFRLKPLTAMILSALAASVSYVGTTQAATGISLAQVEFNDQFLPQRNGKPVDVSRFMTTNPVMPGVYNSDIYVNGNWIGRTDVIFRTIGGADSASPCVTKAMLEMAGIDFERLSPEALEKLAASSTSGACLQLGELISDATAQYDSSDLRLDLSLPQISLRRSARGYISPEFWDKGVNAGILSYNFNAFRVQGNGTPSNTSYYLGLNGGINVGDWRLRNNSSMTKQSGGERRFQNIATYLQRDIVPLRSQLLIGDSYTSGQLFDSIGFRGVRLASDDRMLPDTQGGYAPIVRGIARSNARVRVMQNGNLLYETTVAPGQFEINDLYPTGYGGDLNVEVLEADGSRQSFLVPYASIAQLLRPGNSRYSVTAGRTRNATQSTNVNFTQATYERGMTNDLTLFTGAILAPDYLSILGGAAFNTPLGAMSAGLTQSHAKVAQGDTRNGQSLRLDYSKAINETGTNFSLAAYRYSSSGFLRLQDMLSAKDFVAQGRSARNVDLQRHQLQLVINQALGGTRGSLYVSGSSQNYWNRAGSNTQFQLGYNNTSGVFTYNFSIQRQRDLNTGATDTQYYASVSFPLGREAQSPTLSTSVTRSDRGGSSMQSTLNGTAGNDNAFSYSVTGTRDQAARTASANADYRSTYANLGASVGRSSNGSSQSSARVAGAIVAHPGGVTLSQYVGETIGVVEAKDAGGAAVNTAGVRVDGRGYAVVPYLTPYRLNEVALDPKGLSTDVELSSTSQRVAPRAGSVVMLKYATITGRSVLIQVQMPKGESLPFGAEAIDEHGNVVGLAGQGGRIFMRAAEKDSGKLLVKWGSEANEQCSLNYSLPKRDEEAKGVIFDNITAACIAGGK
jgi:outer membrane usher protein